MPDDSTRVALWRLVTLEPGKTARKYAARLGASPDYVGTLLRQWHDERLLRRTHTYPRGEWGYERYECLRQTGIRPR